MEQTPWSGQPFTQYDGGYEYGLITIDVLMLAGLNMEVLRLWFSGNFFVFALNSQQHLLSRSKPYDHESLHEM